MACQAITQHTIPDHTTAAYTPAQRKAISVGIVRSAAGPVVLVLHPTLLAQTAHHSHLGVARHHYIMTS